MFMFGALGSLCSALGSFGLYVSLAMSSPTADQLTVLASKLDDARSRINAMKLAIESKNRIISEVLIQNSKMVDLSFLSFIPVDVFVAELTINHTESCQIILKSYNPESVTRMIPSLEKIFKNVKILGMEGSASSEIRQFTISYSIK